MSSIGEYPTQRRVYLERDKENASLVVAKSFTNSMKAIEKQKKPKLLS